MTLIDLLTAPASCLRCRRRSSCTTEYHGRGSTEVGKLGVVAFIPWINVNGQDRRNVRCCYYCMGVHWCWLGSLQCQAQPCLRQTHESCTDRTQMCIHYSSAIRNSASATHWHHRKSDSQWSPAMSFQNITALSISISLTKRHSALRHRRGDGRQYHDNSRSYCVLEQLWS